MLFGIVEIIAVALLCCMASVHYIHVLQMGRYQIPAYRNWRNKNRDHVLMENVLWAFVGGVLKLLMPVLISMFVQVEATRNAIANWLTLAIFAGIAIWIALRDYRMPSKKPFVYTQRVRRFSIVLLLECLLGSAILELISIPPYFLFAGMPFLVELAAMIIEPYENRLNAGFFQSAKKKIRQRKDLITIGITGSYGKTNVKFILREILSTKYNVLATPASFNTAMGISRVINDQLTNAHQVFIAEMGATHVGDIKELVDLVKPKHGILTSIGPRHIDSFGSLANIAGTKYELIQGLPRDGIAVFGSGDGYIDRLFAKCQNEKYRVGLEGDGEVYMTAKVVAYSPKGSNFFLECENGDRIKCRTRLLGSYNIKNILLAATLAHKMGLSLEEIAEGIRRLQPIEHRMQLVSEEGYTVIDDSCNEDSEGAFEAVKVLAQMPGRRIVVTPGLTDVGGKEMDVNFALGTVMADGVDTVILVGERPGLRGLIRGLMQSGFSRSNIQSAGDAEVAEEILKEIISDGDTVLYESQIPDYE